MEEPGQCERCSLLYSNYTGRLVANYSITVADWVEGSVIPYTMCHEPLEFLIAMDPFLIIIDLAYVNRKLDTG